MARQKRVNNSLDQLRSLLPFQTSLKRDMASLLEQTVEYINTMHTVLNEEKPACLSKVYMIYQRKVEENEYLRKGKVAKRKIPAAGCSYAAVEQHQHAHAFQGYHGNTMIIQEQSNIDSEGKRHCPGLSYDQGVHQQGMSSSGQSSQNWHQQQLLDPTITNINNNSIPNSYISYVGDCRSGVLNTNRNYFYGQSPLTNQYTIVQKQNEQPSPYTNARFIPPFSKLGNIPKPITQCSSSPIDAGNVNLQHSEMIANTSVGVSCNHSELSSNKTNLMDDMIAKARKSYFNISNLVSSNDQRNEHAGAMHINQSPWQQQQSQPEYVTSGSCTHLVKQEPPHHHTLVSPMDMTISPNSGDSSPTFMGNNKLPYRGRDLAATDYSAANKNVGISMTPSSVSSMLNEVTTTNDFSNRSYGSTEGAICKQQITPMFSSSKWQSQVYIPSVCNPGRTTLSMTNIVSTATNMGNMLTSSSSAPSVKTLSNQAVTAKPKEDVSKRRPTSGSEITVQPLNCVVQSTASLMPSVPVDQNNNKAKEGEKLLTEVKQSLTKIDSTEIASKDKPNSNSSAEINNQHSQADAPSHLVVDTDSYSRSG